MGEEIQAVEGDAGWRKAIPEARDRLQSRVLVLSWGIAGMDERWTLQRTTSGLSTIQHLSLLR